MYAGEVYDLLEAKGLMQGAGLNGIDLSRTPAQIFNDIALSGRCSALITVTRESDSTCNSPLYSGCCDAGDVATAFSQMGHCCQVASADTAEEVVTTCPRMYSDVPAMYMGVYVAKVHFSSRNQHRWCALQRTSVTFTWATRHGTASAR